jgi:hypothetical protein
MQWRVTSEADVGFDVMDSSALKNLEEVDIGGIECVLYKCVLLMYWTSALTNLEKVDIS